MSDAHIEDAYAKLNALCRRNQWVLGVERLRGVFSLRVYRQDEPYLGCTFRNGGENEAARELLHRLREVAA